MAKFDIKDLKTEATRGLYAGAGVADLAVEAVRDYVADVQKKFADVQKDVTTRVADVQKSVTEFEFEPKALREQAVTVVNARVEAISKDAKARRAAIEARVAELQTEAKTYPAKVQASAGDTYGDLVKRGEVLVARIRKQESTQATATAAKTTTTKAKTTATQAKKTAKKSPAKKSAKATSTAAKKTATSAASATTDAASKVGD
jgi:hypothetical protein